MDAERSTAAAMLVGYLKEFLGILANALGVAEKLSKLVPEKRNRRLFTEVIEPAYDALLDVHTKYLEIFNWLHGEMPMRVGDGQWLVLSANETLDDEQLTFKLQAIKEDFAKRSGPFNGVRTSLRSQAESYVRVFDVGSPERAFIWAVVEYFLRRDPANRTVDRLLQDADQLADLGSHALLNSPASGVMNLIANESNPQEIAKIVDYERVELAKRFSDVSRCFHHTKRELLALK